MLLSEKSKAPKIPGSANFYAKRNIGKTNHKLHRWLFTKGNWGKARKKGKGAEGKRDEEGGHLTFFKITDLKL